MKIITIYSNDDSETHYGCMDEETSTIQAAVVEIAIVQWGLSMGKGGLLRGPEGMKQDLSHLNRQQSGKRHCGWGVTSLETPSWRHHHGDLPNTMRVLQRCEASKSPFFSFVETEFFKWAYEIWRKITRPRCLRTIELMDDGPRR